MIPILSERISVKNKAIQSFSLNASFALNQSIDFQYEGNTGI